MACKRKSDDGIGTNPTTTPTWTASSTSSTSRAKLKPAFTADGKQDKGTRRESTESRRSHARSLDPLKNMCRVLSIDERTLKDCRTSSAKRRSSYPPPPPTLTELKPHIQNNPELQNLALELDKIFCNNNNESESYKVLRRTKTK
ncbi:uncharacterized protein LOC102800492 [Saccoglossus kowalevskii]|uniref:Uncharacterized protein LOC102800492 n=1 Tax=Saccoglossus kowalevskii TaxID=10224 RepID=A0ABM0MT39_SACKO|nr:PREDICTED: uncharacterized protein LOC102800492 [Saccoglossus kowalevskii]